MNLIYPKVNGTIDVYMEVLRAICGDTSGKSMIDLCCCTAPNTPRLGFEKRTYVDMIDRKMDHPEEQQFFVQTNVLNIHTHRFLYNPVDVAMCLDGIEHFLFADGQRLLQLMEDISLKQIIFTPTTALFGIAEIEDSDPEAHRSLWEPKWFEDRGWDTITFPDFHPTWNSGAFFATRTRTMRNDFERVEEILNSKPWAKL